ncbi:MAG: hypothetical protein HC769_15845 [Cyanobacteria bacterium CRU_2_1]|nr:hypothetical protein [Cyanobacteria bacterium RU_5_0]NJR60172.1 hypothetical protein [Cyanobacteria bacterium CRU_2_1]
MVSNGFFAQSAESRHGNLSLSEGTLQRTEGVQVYKFVNGTYSDFQMSKPQLRVDEWMSG